MTSELKREIQSTPAFDKRSDKPGKDYGIHGLDLHFVVIGEKGAVQFLLHKLVSST